VEFARIFVSQNNTYRNHFAARHGGVMFVNNTLFYENNSSFSYNFATYGGALKFDTISYTEVRNAIFQHNIASGFGGAIVVNNIFNNCLFENIQAYNHTAVYIGAVFFV